MNYFIILGTEKLSKLATVHVDKHKGSTSKTTNENKLLSSKQKYVFSNYGCIFTNVVSDSKLQQVRSNDVDYVK